MLYQNETYNYGFATFGSDVYVRMPGDLNPNSYYIALHATSGDKGNILLNGPNIRLSGFEVRMADVRVQADATWGILDHNLFLNASVVYQGRTGANGAPSAYPQDHLVQFNYFHDTGTWSVDPAYPAIHRVLTAGSSGEPPCYRAPRDCTYTLYGRSRFVNTRPPARLPPPRLPRRAHPEARLAGSKLT